MEDKDFITQKEVQYTMTAKVCYYCEQPVNDDIKSYLDDKTCCKTCYKVVRFQEPVLEVVSDLEHQQWMYWSQYVADNHELPKQLTDKWSKNWKKYEELTEKEKEKDRKWARKALKPIKAKIRNRIDEIEEQLQETTALNKLNRNDLKARKQELEKQLEEIEQR